jgi:hypothetical protein
MSCSEVWGGSDALGRVGKHSRTDGIISPGPLTFSEGNQRALDALFSWIQSVSD